LFFISQKGINRNQKTLVEAYFRESLIAHQSVKSKLHRLKTQNLEHTLICFSSTESVYQAFRRQFPNGHHSCVTPEEIDRLWERGCELLDCHELVTTEKNIRVPASEVARAVMEKANFHILEWYKNRGKYPELNHRLSAVIALLSLKGLTSWRSASRVAVQDRIEIIIAFLDLRVALEEASVRDKKLLSTEQQPAQETE
jgi:hypothetical protein